jgi:hypothetical protein
MPFWAAKSGHTPVFAHVLWANTEGTREVPRRPRRAALIVVSESILFFRLVFCVEQEINFMDLFVED